MDTTVFSTVALGGGRGQRAAPSTDEPNDVSIEDKVAKTPVLHLYTSSVSYISAFRSNPAHPHGTHNLSNVRSFLLLLMVLGARARCDS